MHGQLKQKKDQVMANWASSPAESFSLYRDSVFEAVRSIDVSNPYHRVFQ